MNKYEILFIVDAALSDEDKEKAVANVCEVISSCDGKAGEPDKWGVKKYAYPINYKTEGYYACIEFEADDKAPAKISAKLNIDKNIVRHMIVSK